MTKREYHKQWRDNNKDKTAAYTKTYTQANQEKLIEYRKNYYLKNKIKMDARRKARYLINKEEQLRVNKLWRLNNPEKNKLIARKKNLMLFGLTLEQYDNMLAAQNFRCAICERHKDEFKKAFAVDHNHVTKENRGLLCVSCNPAIGLFKEKVKSLQSAILYLEKYNGK